MSVVFHYAIYQPSRINLYVLFLRIWVMSEGEYRVLLFLSGVRERDAGEWTCRAILDGQLRCGTVTLTVSGKGSLLVVFIPA